jgi:hypothetical protein
MLESGARYKTGSKEIEMSKRRKISKKQFEARVSKRTKAMHDRINQIQHPKLIYPCSCKNKLSHTERPCPNKVATKDGVCDSCLMRCLIF